MAGTGCPDWARASNVEMARQIGVLVTRARSGWGRLMKRVIELYRYVWSVSGRAQIGLIGLALVLFLLDLAPLELQRRIVNGAVGHQQFGYLALLCLVYVGAVLVQGGLKLLFNVYRGAVVETANQRLRLEPGLVGIAGDPGHNQSEADGVAISIIVSEVEAVGGFVGASFSDPVLNGGILLSIFGYMIFMQPWMALVALLLFVPQVLFIPLLQAAINRRTESRIQALRSVSVQIVDGTGGEAAYRGLVGDVYRLNMEIYRRKFGMNFLMNLLHQLGTIGILAVGSWLLLNGRTEVGTIVAFIAGLHRMTDPWGDLVNYFRDLTNAGVKFAMIATALGGQPGAVPSAATASPGDLPARR